MELGKSLQAIGEQLEILHTKTGTSMTLICYMQDSEARFNVWFAASDIGTFEFPTAQAVINWATLVNQDVNPHEAATRIVRAEQLRVQQIELDAQIAVISKEVEDLPESQRILLAKAEAQARLDDANAKLAEYEKQLEAVEAEAIAKEAELAAVEAELPVKEVDPVVEVKQ